VAAAAAPPTPNDIESRDEDPMPPAAAPKDGTRFLFDAALWVVTLEMMLLRDSIAFETLSGSILFDLSFTAGFVIIAESAAFCSIFFMVISLSIRS
jgi:hypothetical protein